MKKCRFFVFLSSIFALSLFLMSCGGGGTAAESDPNSIPKFSGMAITDKSPLTDKLTMELVERQQYLSFRMDGEETEPTTDIPETTGSEDDKVIEVPEDNMPSTPENADIEENLLPEISVKEGANITPFYAEVNQDVFVSVSIVNPKSFAILRFTLNGVVYQSYQFEAGSTSELLVLKVNSGATPGIKEFTIDEIKYVSDVDNQIRDAIISGNQTVKLSVQYDRIPSASINNESQDLSSYEATVFISDPLSLIDFTKQDCKLYFTDGENIMVTKDLEKGANTFKVDNLVMGKTYQYMVVANYDDLSADGYTTHLLIKKDVNTTMFAKLTNVSANYDEIAYDYKIVNSMAKVEGVWLFKDGEAVAKGDETSTFGNLLSNTAYEIRLYYSFVLEGKDYMYYDSFKVTTLAHKVPTVNATFKVYESSVQYEVFVDDEDNLLTLKSIKLYTQNGDFIANVSYDTNVIENLNRNANYVLKFLYAYNLNDGNGEQEAEKVVAFSTTKFVPEVEIKPYSVTKNQISFDLIVTDPNVVGRINSIRLYKAGTKTFVTQLNDTIGRTFTGLTPNTNYLIEIGYVYDLDDGNGSQMVTFELEVSTAKQLPTFTAEVTALEDGFEIKPVATDPDKAGSLKSAEVLLDGEVVKEATTGALMTIDELLSNKEYEVKVVYAYDLLDMNGEQELVFTKNIKTLEKNKPVIKVTGQGITYSSFNINIAATDPSNILNMDKIEVKLGTVLVKEITDLENDLALDNLYSNNRYEIVVYYNYDLNDGTGVVNTSSSYYISTLKRDDIVYEYTGMLSGVDSIEFNYKITDKEKLSNITAIELFDADGNLVESLDDLTVRKFENLALEAFYSIVTTYKFDLNDNKGEQEEKITIKYGTSGSKIYVNSLQVLNNENPSVGDEVQVRVTLDNPNDLKVTGIFISGNYCEVLNNSLSNGSVIIKFIPDTEGGYYEVCVTGYEYESAGIKLQDQLTSEFKEEILVMGELDILDYFVISDTNYENFAKTPMRMLEISNPTGYEIRSITYRNEFYSSSSNPTLTTTNFQMIDESHVLITEKGSNSFDSETERDFYDLAITSITYGIGDVTKELKINYMHSYVSLYSNVVHISTVDDLLSISNDSLANNYYYEDSFKNYYILDNDIDLASVKWVGLVAGGVFDGNGHTIKNLTTVIEDSANESQYYGLFKEFRGIIFNLKLEDLYMSIKTDGLVSVAGICASKGRVYDSSVSGHIDVKAPRGYVTGVSNTLWTLNNYYGNGVAVSTNNSVNDLEIILTQTTGNAESNSSINNLSGALVTDLNKFSTRKDGSLSRVEITYDVAKMDSLAFGDSYLKMNDVISYPIYIGDESNTGALYLNSDLYDREYHIHTNCDIEDITKTGIAITKVEVERDGYFVSWYDNEEFSGDPITFPYLSEDKLDIYAKWEKYTLANPNYTYRYTSWWPTNNTSIEGYVIESFNVEYGQEATLVIGGYYNGIPVFGVDYEAIRELRTDSDGNENWNMGYNTLTVYYTNTVNFKYNGSSIPAKATYFATKFANVQQPGWSGSGPNVYVPKEFEDYYNKLWFSNNYDTNLKVKTFTSANNPFDDVCEYAATNDEEAYIKVTVSKADSLLESTKFDVEDLPYSFEVVGNTKYMNYNNSRFAIIGINVYANVDEIVEDELFRYIVYADGRVAISKLLNPNLKVIDLTSLPYVVTEISSRAFEESHVESITLNEGLISIGDYAFANSNLKSITYPESLKEVGSFAFTWCSQLATVIMNNNIRTISESTFYECNSLSNVTFSNSLKTIDSYAFANCNNLLSVIIPSGVKTINNYAFYINMNSENVEYFIPSTVSKIDRAFRNSSNIIVYTPLSNKPVAWNLVENTNNVYLNVYYNIKEIKTNNYCRYLVTSENEVIILKGLSNNVDRTFTFEEGDVVEITQGAFSNKTIDYVVLPSSVTKLGASSFADSTQIYSKSNTAPSDFDDQIISKVIFGIVDVIVGKEYIYALDVNNQASIIATNGDYSKDSVDFNIPNVEVISIGANVFKSNRYIRNVIIPEGVTTIGNSAFYGTNIKSVQFPSTLKTIGENAFNSTSIVDISFPDSLERIENYAFNCCWSLKNVSLNENLKYIGESAFCNNNLKVLDLPATIESIRDYGVKISGDGVILVHSTQIPSGWSRNFAGNVDGGMASSNPEILYDNGTKYVYLYIDADYNSDYKVLYTNEITSKPTIGLYNSSSIEGWYLDKEYTQPVTFPFEATDFVTYIYAKIKKYVSVYYYADDFISTYNLASGYAPLTIDEPELTKENSYAELYFDSSFTSKVTFPYTVTSNLWLYTKWITAEEYTVGDLTYYVNRSGEKVLSSYKGNDSVVDLSSIPNLSKIGNNVFERNRVIKEVIIPNTVTEICSWAFYNSSIEKIVIPSSVKKIGASAFHGCNCLVSITLNEGLEVIDSYAFYDVGARAIIVPNSVTVVNECGLRSENLYVILGDSNTDLWASDFNGAGASNASTVIENDGNNYIIPIVNTNYAGTLSPFMSPLSTQPNVNLYEGTIVGWYYDQDYTQEVSFPINTTDRITFIYAKVAKRVYTYKYINGSSYDYVNGYAPLTVEEPVYSVEGYYVEGWYDSMSYTNKYTFPLVTDKNLYLYPKLVEVEIKDDTTNEFYYYKVGNDTVISRYYGHNTNLDLSTLTDVVEITAEAFANNSTLVSIILPSSVRTIGRQAFMNCSNLQTIQLNDGIVSIGDSAFYQCTKLTSISLPASLRTLGSKAFYGCYKLVEIEIPEGVKSIENQTFVSCNELKRVVLPSTLTTIGSSAFTNCMTLSSINLPEGLISIGDYAFASCNSLMVLEIPSTVIRIEWCGIRTNGNGVVIINSNSVMPSGWSENYYGQAETQHPTLINNNAYKWVVLIYDNPSSSIAILNNVEESYLTSITYYDSVNGYVPYTWYTDSEFTNPVTYVNGVFTASEHIVYLYGKK